MKHVRVSQSVGHFLIWFMQRLNLAMH